MWNKVKEGHNEFFSEHVRADDGAYRPISPNSQAGNGRVTQSNTGALGRLPTAARGQKPVYRTEVVPMQPQVPPRHESKVELAQAVANSTPRLASNLNERRRPRNPPVTGRQGLERPKGMGTPSVAVLPSARKDPDDITARRTAGLRSPVQRSHCALPTPQAMEPTPLHTARTAKRGNAPQRPPGANEKSATPASPNADSLGGQATANRTPPVPGRGASKEGTFAALKGKFNNMLERWNAQPKGETWTEAFWGTGIDGDY